MYKATLCLKISLLLVVSLTVSQCGVGKDKYWEDIFQAYISMQSWSKSVMIQSEEGYIFSTDHVGVAPLKQAQ